MKVPGAPDCCGSTVFSLLSALGFAQPNLSLWLRLGPGEVRPCETSELDYFIIEAIFDC